MILQNRCRCNWYGLLFLPKHRLGRKLSNGKAACLCFIPTYNAIDTSFDFHATAYTITLEVKYRENTCLFDFQTNREKTWRQVVSLFGITLAAMCAKGFGGFHCFYTCFMKRLRNATAKQRFSHHLLWSGIYALAHAFTQAMKFSEEEPVRSAVVCPCSQTVSNATSFTLS